MDPPGAQPWWDPDKAQHYSQSWLPQPLIKPSTHVRLLTESHFDHVRYVHKVPQPHEQSQLFHRPGPPIEKFNTVLRTRSVRWYPTSEQKRWLRRCMLGCRLLRNHAIRTVDRQMKKNKGRFECYPGNKYAMRKRFVYQAINKLPERLRWIKLEVPVGMQAGAIMQLAVCYDNENKKSQTGLLRGTIKTQRGRNSRSGLRGSLSVELQNFAAIGPTKVNGKSIPHKQRQHSWEFYIKRCPRAEPVFKKRDRHWMATNGGPTHDVRIVETNTAKFYMKILIDKPVQPSPPSTIGRTVGLDPGSNPFCTYYSPSTQETGSTGTEIALNRCRAIGHKIDALRSKTYGAEAKAKYTEVQRTQWRHRIHQYYEKLRGMGEETVHKTSRFLVDTYQYIEASSFAVDKVVKRVHGSRRRLINSVAARDLMGSLHGYFKKQLQFKVEEYAQHEVYFESETLGTKICGRCGIINKVSGKKFKCGACSYEVHRDVNGARNKLLMQIDRYSQWTP